MLKNVILERSGRHGRGRDDGKRDAHPFAVEEKEQLVVEDRTAETAAEMIHRGARLVISRRGVGEIIRGVQERAIPDFVQISVELVGAGFGDVVDLRGAVSSLIHRVRKRIDGHFGNRIQAQHQICGKSAVQIRKRIVGFQAVHDVAVRERGQPVELHIAVAVRAADEIVTAAGRVDQRAGANCNG